MNYKEYINSDAWRRKRAEKLAEVGHECHDCRLEVEYHIDVFGEYPNDWWFKERAQAQRPTGPLHVHHLTYERLGNEKISDLRVLCPYHHIFADCRVRRDSKRRRWEKVWSKLPDRLRTLIDGALKQADNPYDDL